MTYHSISVSGHYANLSFNQINEKHND
ncbi:hypothetical protein METHP14_1200005 [Pseudomonas sp. P14-2025]